jgi:DNA-binding transcriptional ArsR family regulator
MIKQPALFQILSDPARQHIVDALRGGEQPVNALVAQVGIAQSGVSRHLRILHQAGAVQMRAQGQQRYYALRAEPFAELDLWLNDYRALWSGRLDRMASALAAKQMEGKVD